eukprot:CCRYP_000937-RA/>CCRYP_000937-RA protein AED:0.10 eAED:0.10 QI:0/-1/0/1/-1/1/1/0/1055
MFRLKTGKKSSSDINSREDDSSRVLDETCRASSNIIDDRNVGVDDPLLLRLNHQRQLNEEKSSRKGSKTFTDSKPEVFIGWDHAKKDPFDLESTSSDEEDKIHHNKNTYGQDNEGNFLGWGARSYSSLDEVENEKILLSPLSVKSDLSEISSSKKLQQLPSANEGHCLVPSSPQYHSEQSVVDVRYPFIKQNDEESQLSRDYTHQDLSVVLDTQSTYDDVPLPTSSVVGGMMRTVKSHSNMFLLSLNPDEDTAKSPLQSILLDQSSDRSQGALPPMKRLSRRPTFLNILSGSLGIGVSDANNSLSTSIKVSGSETPAQSQAMVQSCVKVGSEEEEEESPRLQQLKEQSVDELRNEMYKMQVQAQNNLERSWAEAERIRRSNDELDEMISSLRMRLAEAQATPTSDAIRSGSPSQESCAMATTSEIIQPKEKVPTRSFSSAALSMLLGNNDDFYDENTQTVLTKDPPIKRKSKARRRRTFMSELSSGFGIGALRANNAIDISNSSRCSDVGMSIDDYSEQIEGALSQASSYFNQYYDDDNSGILHSSRYNDDSKSITEGAHGASDYDYFFSPEDATDGQQKSLTDYDSVADHDKFGDMRSAIESVYSGTNFLQFEDHNIFHAEASVLIVDDLNDRLTKTTEELVQRVEAVRKQDNDIKSCLVEIEHIKSNEAVKKLQELESTAVLDLNDFNRCFRSLDGKLQSIESIGFDIKNTLDKSKCILVFDDVRLDEDRLLQAKDLVRSDIGRLRILEILNDSLSFRHYYESREKIIANILRMEFLEADLWNQLVNIRLCIEQVGDEEGTQTTESSMASERRALERVFIETILPHIEFAQLTKNTALRFMQDNVKVLKWWNHLIHCMECFKSCHDVTSCVDFILNEPTLSLQKDVSLLERIIHVTSENLDNIKSDVRQECKSFRSKVERAGLLFNQSSNEMSLDDKKTFAKSGRALQIDHLQNTRNNEILQKREVLSERDKTLKHHAAQLETVYSSAQHEIRAQLQKLEKMHNNVQMFTSKMLEQDSLLSSLKKAHAKKEKKVIRLKKIAEGSLVGDHNVSF